MRTTKSVTISLPPAQLKQAERLAKQENRTMSELFREALRRYQQQEEQPRNMLAALRALQEDAKARGLNKMTKREINATITAARKEIGATKGKKSATNLAGR